MANNWNIPSFLEQEIRQRDKVCVYCGVEFTSLKISKKQLSIWLQSKYCKDKNITSKNVAQVIKDAIKDGQ